MFFPVNVVIFTSLTEFYGTHDARLLNELLMSWDNELLEMQLLSDVDDFQVIWRWSKIVFWWMSIMENSEIEENLFALGEPKVNLGYCVSISFNDRQSENSYVYIEEYLIIVLAVCYLCVMKSIWWRWRFDDPRNNPIISS